MEVLFISFAVILTYVTFFMILIPLEVYFVYINARSIAHGEWMVPLCSLFAIIFYVSYFVATKRAPFNGKGSPSKLLRNSILYKFSAKYRPTRLHKTAELPNNQQYIMGVHPHSTIPTFVSIAMMTEGCNFSEIFPGITRRALAASTNFIFPVWREVYLWLGYVDASKKSAQNVLKEGHSVIVLVGGEQEMIKARPNENILCLRNRKGFVRLALESGAHLVPVFAFKANDCYSPLFGLETVNKFLSKRYRIVLPIVYGAWGTPWPRRVPVDVVVGAPIPVVQSKNYTNDDVDRLHEQYINSLIHLYKDNKDRFGSSDRELIIVDADDLMRTTYVINEKSSDTSIPSIIIDITITDARGNQIRNFENSLTLCISGLPESDEDNCLGFYDTNEEKWKCEDECLVYSSSNGGTYCGETDHLTSFAVLFEGTTGNNINPCDSGDISYLFAWISFGFVLVALCFIFIGVIAIEIYYTQKKRATQAEFSRISRLTHS